MQNKSILIIVSIGFCLFFPRVVFPWNPIGDAADKTMELYRQAMLLGDTTWAETIDKLARENRSKSTEANNRTSQQEEKDDVIFRPVNNSQSAVDSENHTQKVIVENPSTTEVGYLSPKTIEYLGEFDVTGVKNEDVGSNNNETQPKTTEKVYSETAKYRITGIHTCNIMHGFVKAVCATYENKTDKTVKGVRIRIYLYNEQGVRVGQTTLFEERVLPQEKVVFTSFGDEIPVGVTAFKVLEVTENNEY
jgi:hypothetical protein